ncbi:MAG: SIS domain-containing protein [Solirubrobacteraceae bacterium]|nr:SIS domain-containing protein [Solirubrobacteraceae bacterium]
MADAQLIQQRFIEASEVKRALASEGTIAATEQFALWTIEAIRAGRKIIFMGNGGSAADSTHLAAEFVGRYTFDREPMPALALADNLASITAIGNDYDYSLVFARQLKALGNEGDILVGMTTSGSSRNVVEGLKVGNERGLRTISITGQGGGEAADLADLALLMPADTTARIQECTMTVCHTVCELVEKAIFPR